MATAAVTASYPGNINKARLTVLTFGSMANNDTGTPIDVSGFAQASIQVSGTFGVGGSVALQGSNDGVTYFALRNKAGTIIAITAAGGDVSDQLSLRFVRPAVTAGDGTTALICVMAGTNPI